MCLWIGSLNIVLLPMIGEIKYLLITDTIFFTDQTLLLQNQSCHYWHSLVLTDTVLLLLTRFCYYWHGLVLHWPSLILLTQCCFVLTQFYFTDPVFFFTKPVFFFTDLDSEFPGFFLSCPLSVFAFFILSFLHILDL